MDIQRLIAILDKGIKVGKYLLKAEDIGTGRFIEERDLELFLINSNTRKHLMFIKAFPGRAPYYKGWIELFAFNPEINFFRTPMEKKFLSIISDTIGPGESIFIEYAQDKQTKQMLYHSAKAEDTPLGKILLDLGFKWFKDWYFPEGALEGGQKLQAQK